jgi:hypothetical protein
MLPNFEWYRDAYGGKLSELEFNIELGKAEIKVNDEIYSREIPEDMETRYWYAICEVVDCVQQYQQQIPNIFAGSLKSERVGAYHIAYDSKHSNNLNSAMTLAVHNIVVHWLSYPTNLTFLGNLPNKN